MNQEHRSRAQLGLQALRRAARKVAADARLKGYKVPYWIDGRIQHIIPGPEALLEDEIDREDPESAEDKEASAS